MFFLSSPQVYSQMQKVEMACRLTSDTLGEIEYEIRIPKREELQQVIDIANADDWNVTVETLYEIYDVEKEGFRAAVDKRGNLLGKYKFRVCQMQGQLA